jgi:hypothetical protein
MHKIYGVDNDGRQPPSSEGDALREWRLRCPYGKWTCADGREVLHNRSYMPILERRPGEQARPARPGEWVDHVDEELFFDDHTRPERHADTLARVNAVLAEWGREALPPAPPEPTRRSAEIIPFRATPYTHGEDPIPPLVNPWAATPFADFERRCEHARLEAEEAEAAEPPPQPKPKRKHSVSFIVNVLHGGEQRIQIAEHHYPLSQQTFDSDTVLDVECPECEGRALAFLSDDDLKCRCLDQYGLDCWWRAEWMFEWPKEDDEAAPPEPIAPIDLWGKLDPPELPRGLLPDVIERFAVTQGELMGVDPGGLAVAALTVCAATIPDTIELQVKRNSRGWTESARLWAALIGLPSTKKSPILREVVRPLSRIDAQYAREYRAAKEQWDQLDAEARRRTPKPRRRQLKLEDTTIESAQEVLNDNPQGVLCLQDELGGWFGSMDKYNSARGAAKDRGFWLQCWNGGTYSVNRVTRGCYLIENASVSVLGGIQPDVIREVVDETHDDGLIQRLCPVVLRPGAAGKDEATHEIVTTYERLVERLHGLKPTFVDRDNAFNNRAEKLELDDGAQAIRRRLEQRHQELMGLEVINKKLASHIGKYDAFFARLCAVWHCVEHAAAPDGLPCFVTADTADRVAKFLHQFLLRHALAFYAGMLDLSDDHDRLAAVAGHILAHKLEHVTNRDVARGDRTMRGLTRRETESVFEQLEALGWVFRIPPKRAGDPPSWDVNPEVHRLFAGRAEQEASRRAEVRKLMAGLGREKGDGEEG